jgi:hypothetical protein
MPVDFLTQNPKGKCGFTSQHNCARHRQTPNRGALAHSTKNQSAIPFAWKGMDWRPGDRDWLPTSTNVGQFVVPHFFDLPHVLLYSARKGVCAM